MGKANKAIKRKQRRHNPVRVPDNHLGHGTKVAEQTSDKKGQVIPVLQKLDSPEVEDRRWACVAVTNLIQNDASTRRLLQAKGVVDKLILRLTDPAEDVVAEAVGALRNLCVDGGYDMSAHVFNKNVLSPLKTFIPKITTTLQEYLGPTPPKHSEGLKGRIYEFAENAITLFWCLSETSNKALNAINDANLTPFLMAFLMSRDKIPSKTVASAAQCLFVLSDDNDPSIAAIRKVPAYVSCLLDITHPKESRHTDEMVVDKPSEDDHVTLLKVLACGILRNIRPLPASASISESDFDKNIALPLLTPVISYSLDEVSTKVQELAATDAVLSKPAKNLKATPGSDHKTPSEVELDQIENRLRIVELAVEIMTALCATLPDPEPVTEDDDDEEEMDDEEGEAEEEQDASEAMEEAAPNPEPPKPASTLSLIASLTRPLLSLARPTPLSFPPTSAPPAHPPTTSLLTRIHIRALECLNNLFLGVDPENTKLPEGAAQQAVGVWAEVWETLAIVGRSSDWTVGTSAPEARREFWGGAVGVLWGLARIGKGELVPDAEQVSALIEFCSSSSEDPTKVKCIGTLACLAQRPDAIAANKIIGEYLFSYLTQPHPTPVIPYPETVLHAANAIIDVYSDEAQPYDVNFRENGWTEALAASEERVKRAGRAVDRKKEGGKELKEFADDVLANVVGFVRYRRKLKL